MALGFIRRHQRWLYGFLWIVIAAFIVLYIPVFFAGGGGPGQTVGRVGKYQISVTEFRSAYDRALQQYQQLYQGRLDPAMARRIGLPDQVFHSLAQQALIAQEANRVGITVDDATLARQVLTDPQFQHNGQFMGAAQLRRLLSLQHISEDQFRESLRRSALRDRLEALITSAVDVTPAEVEQEYRRRNEQVRVEYAIAAAKPFEVGITPSDEDVKAWFDAHKEEYRVPERRVIEYLLLDRDAIRKDLRITDQQVKAYYDANQDEFMDEETVCASHILIKVKSDPKAAQGHDDEQAKKIANGLLEKLHNGADFGQLARKYSEDEGSASKGGDLGCFARGQMVPEFENVAFSLDAGETSGIVRSSFGYHIIHVNARHEEKPQPFDQVRERARQMIEDQQTQEKMEKLEGAIAGDLAKGRSLAEAGQRWNLTPQRTDPLARGASVAPLSSPTVTATAFEMEVGQTQPQPLSVPKGLAFISLAKIEASHLPELKDVRDKVREDIVTHEGLEKARALATKVASSASSEGLARAAAAAGLAVKETPGLVSREQPMGDLGTNAALERAVFALDKDGVTEPLRVDSGYAVVRVVEKKPIDPAAFEAAKASLADSLREAKRRQFFEAYLAEAIKRFPIERTETLREVVGG